jgi:hypothetical protein
VGVTYLATDNGLLTANCALFRHFQEVSLHAPRTADGSRSVASFQVEWPALLGSSWLAVWRARPRDHRRSDCADVP